jgi:hypothetical protein
LGLELEPAVPEQPEAGQRLVLGRARANGRGVMAPAATLYPQPRAPSPPRPPRPRADATPLPPAKVRAEPVELEPAAPGVWERDDGRALLERTAEAHGLDVEELKPEQPGKNRAHRRAATKAAKAEDAYKPPPNQRRERAHKHHERFRTKWLKKHGGEEAPPTIPRWVWLMAQFILADATGKIARWYLLEEKNRVFAGAVRNAALVPLPDGTTRYSWRDKRARTVLAIGMTIKACSRVTKRKGPWSLLTRGVNRCGLLLVVRDVTGGDQLCKTCGNHHPSVAALSGIHEKHATAQTGQVGWLVALEEASAIYREQFKDPDTIKKCCQPWEVGERGYPVNWYWMPGALTDPASLTVEQVTRYRALHELGCDAPDEEITRRVSYQRTRGISRAEFLDGLQAQPP